MLDFVLNIGTEKRCRQQQTFIHQLPLGTDFAGLRFLRFKIGTVGAIPGTALGQGKVIAARRLLGDRIVDVNVAAVGQVVQRPGFPVHQIAAGGGINRGDRAVFRHAGRTGNRTAAGAAAQAGAVIFGLVVIQTDAAVQLEITGNLQGIEGINAEGIRLPVGVGAAAVQTANRDVAIGMVNIDRRRRNGINAVVGLCFPGQLETGADIMPDRTGIEL